YLLDLYKKNPALLNVSYSDHISALFNDAFSGAHMFAPYMRKHGYQDLLIIGNCIPSQAQWAKENNINATISNQDQLIEIARMQVEVFKPHILYLSHPVGWLDSRFVQSLSWKPSLIVGWRGAPSPPGTDWSKFDVILSHLTACKKYALEVGAKNVEHFYPGFPRFIADEVHEMPKKYDIVFSGQWSSLHKQRNEFIKQIAEAPFVQDGKYSVGFFIAAAPGVLPECVEKYNHGPRWGIDMHRVLKSGRVVINAEIDIGRGDAGNMRLFETTGTGSFLLTEYHKNINRYFEPGTEIETFEDSTEMLEKIKYYLEHPEEREAIARNGQERCLKQYSMEVRTAEFNKIVKKYLNNK
ncbi:MAG: glycosyltransferase, partial [Candidatus Heimdallarchaeota archaeon]|nr:glycosyltransferase [Candidatus Heimdallarchaeota archaeon]